MPAEEHQRIVVFQQNASGESKIKGIERYGERFGSPEFRVAAAGGKIAKVEVIRGAPCGAT